MCNTIIQPGARDLKLVLGTQVRVRVFDIYMLSGESKVKYQYAMLSERDMKHQSPSLRHSGELGIPLGNRSSTPGRVNG